MTAAPGPQQPDEVERAHDRASLLRGRCPDSGLPLVLRETKRFKCGVCDCNGWTTQHISDAVSERVIGVVGGELLIQDEQCPITKGRCDRDCGDMCLRSPAQPVRNTEEGRR